MTPSPHPSGCTDAPGQPCWSPARALALAEACAQLSSCRNPQTVFRILDRALEGIYGAARYALLQRVAEEVFEPVPPTRTPAPRTESAATACSRLSGPAWEALFKSDVLTVLEELPVELAPFGAREPPEEAPEPQALAIAVRGLSRLAGAVVLRVPTAGSSREEDVAVGRILGECASSALARLESLHREQDTRDRLAALEQERAQEREWLQALSESARGVTAEWELGRALETIVLQARAYLHLERAAIYRHLPDEGAVQLLVAAGREEFLDRSMSIRTLDGAGAPLAWTVTRAAPSFCFGEGSNGVAVETRPRGSIAVPIAANGRLIGALTADAAVTRQEALESLLRPLMLLADFAAIALTQAWKQQEIAQAEAQKKLFYREILCAVTNGKLTLCERGEIEQYWSWPCVSLPVREERDIREVREVVSDTASAAGLPLERLRDLCLCASEAATNALKHAGGGQAHVVATPAVVRVRVEDHGGGIDHFHLPRATLMKGFSTRASMGLGFTLMHELADRLYLNTSKEGTILILEMNRHPVSEVEQLLSRLDPPE